MRAVLFSAISLNGYIARENGDEDFLSHANWQSVEELAKRSRNLVIGSRTYEAVQNWGERYNFDTLRDVDVKVVLSRERPAPPRGFELARSPEEAFEILAAHGHESAFVVGGSRTNAAFLAAGLIDEIIFNVEPIAIGGGIPVFAEGIPDIELTYLKANPVGGGIIQLHYAVVR